MKNRLQEKITRARRKGEKLFSAFLTLGYPNLETTQKLILQFEKEGVDIIELGFPFSDPLADGPTIQYSSEQALKRGVRMEDAFQMVRDLRRSGCSVPLVFFTYLNPIYHYGLRSFVAEAKQAGFDGLLVPDLPPEEERSLQTACRKRNLSQIFLIAPTTEPKRAKFIAARSQGFIYYVSLRGVTGARKSLPRDIERNLKTFRGIFTKPVLIGFGVSNPKQARQLSRISDGVIVGSAIVEVLRKSGGKAEAAVRFVRQMIRAVKSRKR